MLILMLMLKRQIHANLISISSAKVASGVHSLFVSSAACSLKVPVLIQNLKEPNFNFETSLMSNLSNVHSKCFASTLTS